MTALAFIFGCLPLWTASGSGAASRRILGTVVIGGMTLATLIGILMIPVTFAVVEYLSHRFVQEAGAAPPWIRWATRAGNRFSRSRNCRD
jgi:hypothetical protein